LQGLKQLGKDTILYGLGGVLAKSLSLLLLPVYTRLFSPEDYGIIEMLNLLIAFLMTIMISGTNSAQSFYFFKISDEGEPAQRGIISAVLQWRILWGGICVVFASFCFGTINAGFFRHGLTQGLFLIACATAFFSQLKQQSIEISRLLFRPMNYFGLTIANTLVASGIGLILIIHFRLGVVGYFLGLLSASVILTVIGWYLVKRYLEWTSLRKDWWPDVLKFGVPLIPNGFAMYLLNTSDRWFIANYKGIDELGLYAVGAKFAMTMGMLIQTFRLAWAPVAMKAMQNNEGKSLFRFVGRIYLGLAVSGVILLTASAPKIIDFMVPEEYFQAYPIVGILAWYPVFYGFYLIASTGIWKKEKTAWTPLLMIGAAGLNVFLNSLWVPMYGSLGAAIATSFSFLVWNLAVLSVSEKLWKIDYPYVIFSIQIGLGLVACFAIFKIYSKSFDYSKSFAVSAAAIVMLALLSISKEDFKKISGKILCKFSKN
jgi:O-antigen/teichoic acid export membrane protein